LIVPSVSGASAPPASITGTHLRDRSHASPIATAADERDGKH
jgi:hypothetical protein